MDRPSRASGLPRVRAACGLTAAVVGVLALVGWLTGLRRLAEVRSGYIPMAPNTAIGMILCGGALALLPGVGGEGARRRRVAALALAAPAAVVALLRLVEYATGRDLAVDRWVLRVPGETLGLAPIGRMALLTAAGFVGAYSTLVLVALADGRRVLRDLAAVLALGLASLGGAFAIGYLYDAPFLYGDRTIPMALNTASCFVAIGVGLIAAAGPRSFLLRPLCGPSVRARLMRVFLPFVVASVAASSWAAYAVAAAGGRTAALFTAAVTVSALLIGALLCARLSGRVGERIESAEEALRRANEELEARVAERTGELSRARDQLEERNRELQRAADDLERTAATVRQAHRDLQGAYRELQLAECQLVQAEKLSALGQMVAGVAHEINNPLAFVNNNVAVLQRDVGHLLDVFRLYQQMEGMIEAPQRELMARIRDLAEQFDLAYVIDNLDGMMTRSREGLRRIQQIVKDLRDFVRLDEGDLKEADINDGIRSTVNIIRSLAKSREVALDLDLAPLPPVACYPAKINQVVLNLIANAIDACRPGGRVRVATRPLDDGVEIAVADDGPGIAPEVQAKIFDPFFTTKPVGQGTGLGLSISLGIVRSHGGTIACESAPGEGARFLVRLPRTIPKSAPSAASG